MKQTYDSTVNAAYLKLTNRVIVRTVEVLPGMICDYDDLGHIVGVEVLTVTRNLCNRKA